MGLRDIHENYDFFYFIINTHEELVTYFLKTCFRKKKKKTQLTLYVKESLTTDIFKIYIFISY